mmetsp:Transcript_38903/g.100564  ORF Transcript_38903/g.100564 Transcript_38903/m.100564 type:complete len:291 (-) Transcript_38903:429-1301(-)
MRGNSNREIAEAVRVRRRGAASQLALHDHLLPPGRQRLPGVVHRGANARKRPHPIRQLLHAQTLQEHISEVATVPPKKAVVLGRPLLGQRGNQLSDLVLTEGRVPHVNRLTVGVSLAAPRRAREDARGVLDVALGAGAEAPLLAVDLHARVEGAGAQHPREAIDALQGGLRRHVVDVQRHCLMLHAHDADVWLVVEEPPPTIGKLQVQDPIVALELPVDLEDSPRMYELAAALAGDLRLPADDDRLAVVGIVAPHRTAVAGVQRRAATREPLTHRAHTGLAVKGPAPAVR